MKKISARIVFFGNERLATGVTTAAPTLRGLIESGYDVAAVMVSQAETGKSRAPRELEVAAIAKEHGIPLLTSPDGLAELGAEVGVLVAFGRIIPEGLLDIFPKGIVNVHPSLLPQHRGPTPLESVILEGVTETGVSLMKLAPEMDAGPIFAQQTLTISENETKQGLADKAAAVGAKLVIDNLPSILDGSLQPNPQDDAQATYDKQIEKGDGVIDWSKPATLLEREVRAYGGWPRSRATLGKTDVIITKAHVGRADEPLAIKTGDGYLVIDSLIPAGKKEMEAKSFLAGYSL